MRINKLKNKKAFSLIEIIVYLAIFGTLSIVLIKSLVVSMSSFAIVHSNKLLQESGLSGMERISREIRGATSVDIGNSVFGSSNGVLKLNSSGIKFAKVGNDLNLYADGTTLTGNLIDNNISLDSLIFRRIDTTYGEAIKVEMILRDPKRSPDKTVSFYNTIILRGGY